MLFCLFPAIRNEVTCEAVLDGKIVCIDAEGRPQFCELLRWHGDPVFYVFHLMWLDGENLRELLREPPVAGIASSTTMDQIGARRLRERLHAVFEERVVLRIRAYALVFGVFLLTLAFRLRGHRHLMVQPT